MDGDFKHVSSNAQLPLKPFWPFGLFRGLLWPQPRIFANHYPLYVVDPNSTKLHFRVSNVSLQIGWSSPACPDFRHYFCMGLAYSALPIHLAADEHRAKKKGTTLRS